MDPLTRLFVQLAIWVRHPPSREFVWILVVTLVVVTVVALFEWGFGWPEALTVDRGPRVIR